LGRISHRGLVEMGKRNNKKEKTAPGFLSENISRKLIFKNDFGE